MKKLYIYSATGLSGIHVKGKLLDMEGVEADVQSSVGCVVAESKEEAEAMVAIKFGANNPGSYPIANVVTLFEDHALDRANQLRENGSLENKPGKIFKMIVKFFVGLGVGMILTYIGTEVFKLGYNETGIIIAMCCALWIAVNILTRKS